MSETTIAEALSLVRAGQTEQGLEMLLACWRVVRNPEVAEIIGALSRQIASPPIEGKTRQTRYRAWQNLADDLTERDVDTLLDALPSFSRQQATTLLDELDTWLPDPRVARWLTDQVCHPPDGYQGIPAVAFWERVLELLLVHKDPRQVPRLSAAAEHYATGAHKYRVGEFLGAALLTTLASIHSSEESTVLPPTEAKACEDLRQIALPNTVPTRLETSEESLRTQVYADPSNIELRYVLSDALQELGNPWGEFIALQLRASEHTVTDEQNRRLRELERVHGRSWLGGIERALTRKGLVFRCGFPVAGSLSSVDWPGAHELLDRVEWSTFEALCIRGVGERPRKHILANPALISLRTLRADEPISTNRPLPVVKLQLPSYAHQVQQWARCDCLPNLRRVEFGYFPWPAERLEAWWEPGAIGTSVKELSASGDHWLPWLRASVEDVVPVQRLELESAQRNTPERSPFHMTLVRVPHIQRFQLKFASEQGLLGLGRLVDELRQAPTMQLSCFSLSVQGKFNGGERGRANAQRRINELRTWLEAMPSIEEIELPKLD